MDAVLAPLRGETSYAAFGALCASQLLFWSLALEIGAPVLSAILPVLPLGKRYEKLQGQSGKTVGQEISSGLVLAVQHALAAACAWLGARSGAVDLLRLGLGVEVAIRAHDLVLAAVGLRQHAGAPALGRVFVILYDLTGVGLAIPAAVTYAADSDVQLLCAVLVCSGAALAMLGPMQYALNPMTGSGCKFALALQVIYLLIFVWCRLAFGLVSYRGIYSRVMSVLSADSASNAYVFAAGIFVVSFAFSGFVAFLWFQHARKTRQATKKIKHLRKWFEQNAKDKSEEEIQDHIWKTVKLSEVLVSSPAAMIYARLKSGRKGFAKKA